MKSTCDVDSRNEMVEQQLDDVRGGASSTSEAVNAVLDVMWHGIVPRDPKRREEFYRQKWPSAPKAPPLPHFPIGFLTR